MKLRKEISDLLTAGIINQETADRIENYYQTKAGPPQNKLVIVFGILGSLLVGLGIVLILAHNWDQLSRFTKTVFAFLPLILGQVVCGYTLLKQKNSTAWNEGSSTFLIMAIGACIALISQIYNIPGDLSSFLLTWALLSLPVVYVMNSSVASLLYLTGITWYACETGYWGRSTDESYEYWVMLLLVLPHYFLLYKRKRESNFFTFHNWFIPLSVIICLGTVATEIEELMFIAYMSLFGLLYLIGNIPALREQKIRNNGYLVLGSLGTVALLLILSFSWFWLDLYKKDFSKESWLTSPEMIAATVLSLAALIVLILQKKNQKPISVKPAELIFILFIGIFLIGLSSPLVTIFINILALGLGILTIREGARHHHFGILNYGLLIVTALITCRFFDTDINFVLRGLLFVGVGLGFFYANYRMAKEKRIVKSE
jgi:uncharacterized membrane protein